MRAVRALLTRITLAATVLVAAHGGLSGGAVAFAGDAATLAFQAALAALNGAAAADCRDEGQTSPPGKDTCISMPQGQAGQAASGLVLVQAALAAGVQPMVALIGLEPGGTWALWLTAPAVYVPVQLPAETRVCAPGDLTVRATPAADAAAVATLPDGSMVTVDAFRLTSPGTWTAGQGGSRGEGWYHVAGAVNGWVTAQNLVIADASCGMALLPAS